MARQWGDVSRKVYAATAGAALGEIAEAAAIGALGWEWWPIGPASVIGAFALGYLIREPAPPVAAATADDEPAGDDAPDFEG
jgi:hypothetical protein